MTPPLTPEALEEMEIALGVRLPKDYAEFLLQFNGGAFYRSAEAAADVFFDLWRTPLDARIKVRAAAFEVKRRWELGSKRRHQWSCPNCNRDRQIRWPFSDMKNGIVICSGAPSRGCLFARATALCLMG